MIKKIKIILSVFIVTITIVYSQKTLPSVNVPVYDYSQDVQIVKMDDKINDSNYSSAAPFIAPSNLMLFFTSSRLVFNSKGKRIKLHKGDNIYMATRSSLQSPWETTYLKSVSTDLHDGVVGLSIDGLKLFIRVKHNKIYVLDVNSLKGKKTAVPIKKYYGIKLPKNVHIKSVAMSADEKTFYISSNMPGGYGGFDIWKTEYNDNTKKWSEWKNFGGVINTAGDEISISITNDESALHIASNGHGGVGGCDIFRLDKNSNGDWSDEIVNLGTPINTPLNDIYYSSVGGYANQAYYSSQRTGSDNLFDIYCITYKKPIWRKNGRIKSKQDLQVITERKSDDKHKTQKREHKVAAREKAIMDAAQSKALENNTPGDIYVDQFNEQGYIDIADMAVPKPGDKIYLQNLLFEKGKSVLMKSCFPGLNRLCAFLERFPNVVIEIGGHTSSEGSYEANRRLSEARAESVKKYLIKKGISASRLQTHGYSYSMPVEDEHTELGKILNRRIEVVIIK
ncbi:MAG: OmpA family protein [Bacteroidales bacterium]|jgi:outer membrane protein OmpA-like peptidoglycan-associated protein|nr:OmpA family protein [Bacteroidales bacterium]